MLPERYLPRKVSEISKNDKRVSLVGCVIEKADNSFILDDDSGKVEVFFGEETSKDLSIIEIKKTIRVFCSVIDEKLKLDIVQDLSSLDLNLLKTVDELYSKAGV